MSTPEASERLSRGYNHDDDRLTLRQVRRARGFSLRDVERELGFHRSTLSKVERGIEIRLDIVFACSDLYGVPLEAWQVVHEYRVSPAVLS